MNRINVLDHGYIECVEAWGSDEIIVESARMSTGKGFLGWGPKVLDTPCEDCHGTGDRHQRGYDPVDGAPYTHRQPGTPCKKCSGDGKKRVPGDEKLLRYLYENKHSTPFEMAGMIVEVQAPIFVFRQWHRHRTQSYNEMSARYTPLPDVNYLPTVERLMAEATTENKQAGTASGAIALTIDNAERFRRQLQHTYEAAQTLYETALQAGVSKELARVHLPVARYSRMRASANLRNWLAFLTLRMDPHAQYEIRVFAEALGTFIAERFPRTWELFTKENS